MFITYIGSNDTVPNAPILNLPVSGSASGNKQKIELNRLNIEKYKLKVASTLVEMSVQVK